VVQKYLGAPLQWATTTGATGITRVTGNATAAYALASGTVYQLTGTAWAPVAGITGVADIAAGPTHLYALKTDGSVLQLGSAWTDISCTGAVSATGCAGTGWYTVPVAFSSGDGSFRVTNRCAAPSLNCTADSVIDFAGAASRVPRAELRVVGDFNGDGRTDLAVLDAGNSASPITVAFSNGDGSFRLTQRAAGLSSFAGWIAQGGRPVAGDFDHDGSADIALVGVSGWTTIPVALSNGDGTFRLVNAGGAQNMGAFETAAASTATCNGVSYRATLLSGRFR
jgi:hypothetical protein